MILRIVYHVVFLSLISCYSVAASDCVSLSNFVDEGQDLDAFLSGESQSVLFTVPRSNTPGFGIPSIYCLENVTIPKSINGKNCEGIGADGNYSTCYLLQGIKAIRETSGNDQEYCDSDDRGIAPCYNCVCQGAEPTPSIIPRNASYYSNSCGLSNENNWGVSCPDVNNGRNPNAQTTKLYGRVDTMEIYTTVCPQISNGCNECNGGSQSPFQVGLQWITNVEEQCFNDPFASGVGLHVYSMGLVLATLNAALLLLFV